MASSGSQTPALQITICEAETMCGRFSFPPLHWGRCFRILSRMNPLLSADSKGQTLRPRALRLWGRGTCRGPWLALALLLLAGCISSPTVKRVHPDYWARELSENALTSERVSEPTAAYLALRGWEGKSLRRPVPILQALRGELLENPDRAGLIPYSEFAYLAGCRAKGDSEKTKYFLSAARAAYAAMFDGRMGPPMDPMDPNLRFVADLYNYSLSQLADLLLNPGGATWKSRRIPVVEGWVTLSPRDETRTVAAFSKVFVGFHHKTDALRLPSRRRGLGVPVVTVSKPVVLVEGREYLHPPVYQVGVNPMTLLVRFSDSWLESGESLTAQVEWRHSLSETHIEVEGVRVPLEADPSLSLSLLYDRRSQYRGMLRMPSLLWSDSIVADRGLFLLEPYDPGKIPVVLTHGLMDSPLTWVPMLNALLGDPVISQRYQFWLFFYPTMNPILQSASELRYSLTALCGNVAGEGEGWRDMVLIGHSMGGLITRLLITPSGEPFRDMEKRALERFVDVPDRASYIESVLRFEPLPYVRRAIFLGAPHRGASMANQPVGAIGQGLMRRPEYLRDIIRDETDPDNEVNGIANLSPLSPFTQALNRSTWSPLVPVHSIIGDMRKAGRTNGTDSVVAYWSSHIDGVKSELIVHADHLSLHKKAPALTEVRRILLLHLEEPAGSEMKP